MKKTLKILTAIALVIALAYIFAFFGNPLSRLLAEKSADKYIEETYPSYDFQRDKAFYNFKDGYYKVKLQDKASEDTAFSLSFDSFGSLQYDSYDSILFNTYTRFFMALYSYGDDLKEKNNKPYDISLDIAEGEDYENTLSLDQEVDLQNFPFKITATAKAYAKEPSLDQCMKILQDLDSLIRTTNFEPADYSVILVPEANKTADSDPESWANSVSVFNVPVDLVRAGDLEALEDLNNLQQGPKED